MTRPRDFMSGGGVCAINGSTDSSRTRLEFAAVPFPDNKRKPESDKRTGMPWGTGMQIARQADSIITYAF
jgi:hypothetical protein